MFEVLMVTFLIGIPTGLYSCKQLYLLLFKGERFEGLSDEMYDTWKLNHEKFLFCSGQYPVLMGAVLSLLFVFLFVVTSFLWIKSPLENIRDVKRLFDK